MNESLLSYINLDPLALILTTLVGLIGISVASFSWRYLRGDSNFRRFFVLFGLLVSSVLLMVSADHIFVLVAAWFVTNASLVCLMIHKSSWRQAKASGMLAARNYLLGTFCMLTACSILYLETGQTSIRALSLLSYNSLSILAALVFLLVGVMTQSAIWPFHKWLISSLNSPTPVSALMHAGVINGGGLLLARFSPLYLQSPQLLMTIFVLGITTALLGTLWKLLQSDIKRMLACSTMGQMGFMLAQCGLGLFPAAVAHLVWHGLFKAYLFLASGSAAKEIRYDQAPSARLPLFFIAILCGFFGTFCMAMASGKQLLVADSTVIVTCIAFITATQLALAMLGSRPLRSTPLAFVTTGVLSACYGFSLKVISFILLPMDLMHPQPLAGIHVVCLCFLTFGWLALFFVKNSGLQRNPPEWLLKWYVTALNASQPHPSTITAYRNQYQYS